MGFSGGSLVKNLPAHAEDLGSIPGPERSPGEGNGNPFQHSCLGNPMDRGAWWATIYRAAQSWTPLTGKWTDNREWVWAERDKGRKKRSDSIPCGAERAASSLDMAKWTPVPTRNGGSGFLEHCGETPVHSEAFASWSVMSEQVLSWRVVACALEF